MIWHSVREDVQALDVVARASIFEDSQSGLDAGPQVCASIVSQIFNTLPEGPFVVICHSCQTVDNLTKLVGIATIWWNLPSHPLRMSPVPDGRYPPGFPG